MFCVEYPVNLQKCLSENAFEACFSLLLAFRFFFLSMLASILPHDFYGQSKF